ncbi:hypothetical protein [Tessaracoccus aquimaris]|uniref:hypothetical protein n=1 Tax=Tessaracoccus aquimaris TaxID=1332264 RepID=UPI0011AB4748|nr:hypothetical protein [Tessaracoccus aquimaris]
MSDGQRGWRPAVPGARPASGPQTQPTPPRPAEEAAVTHGEPRFDAIGLQSALTRARDQSRFVAPEIEPELEARSFPLRALLIGFVGVLVVGVLAGFVYVTYLRQRAVDPQVLAKPTGTATNQVRAQTPQEIVTAYFQALADGDIERALAMGPRGGNGSERLITEAAYATTHGKTKIANVQIRTPEQDATRVQVSYTVSGRPVEAQIDLDRLDTGEYQLKRTTVPIRISIPGGDSVPLVVNGVAIDQGQVYEVVPGVYELDTGLPFIAYSEASTITVVTLQATEAQEFSPTPQLTEEGRSAFISAANASLEKCMAVKRKAPADCPIGMSAAAPVDESSIKRTITNSPWTTARPALTSSDQSVAEMTVTVQYTLGYTLLDGGRQPEQSEQAVVTVRANVLGSSEDQVAPIWRV